MTDTDFETGDEIGVTITMADDNSQFLNNKEFKFDGTNFTAPGTLWYEDANLKSSIFAYHPYQTGTAIPTEFSVLGDQNGDNYQKSDLIIGTKTGVKPDRTIGMTFKHKMTRIIIRVTNGTDTDVTEILIKGAIGTGTIDAKTGEFTAKEGGATLDVKACERTKNQLYYALFVPQKGVKLETSVTTSDNKTRSYTLGTTDLTSGTNRELKMNVMPKDLEIILGGQIDNWTDGSELEIETGGSVQEPETPTVSWGGVDYKTVTLKDGRTWMAENLRYVPEGKTPSSDPAEEAGIWYPAANADKPPLPSWQKSRLALRCRHGIRRSGNHTGKCRIVRRRARYLSRRLAHPDQCGTDRTGRIQCQQFLEGRKRSLLRQRREPKPPITRRSRIQLVFHRRTQQSQCNCHRFVFGNQLRRCLRSHDLHLGFDLL